MNSTLSHLSYAGSLTNQIVENNTNIGSLFSITTSGTISTLKQLYFVGYDQPEAMALYSWNGSTATLIQKVSAATRNESEFTIICPGCINVGGLQNAPIPVAYVDFDLAPPVAITPGYYIISSIYTYGTSYSPYDENVYPLSLNDGSISTNASVSCCGANCSPALPNSVFINDYSFVDFQFNHNQ